MLHQAFRHILLTFLFVLSLSIAVSSVLTETNTLVFTGSFPFSSLLKSCFVFPYFYALFTPSVTLYTNPGMCFIPPPSKSCHLHPLEINRDKNAVNRVFAKVRRSFVLPNLSVLGIVPWTCEGSVS